MQWTNVLESDLATPKASLGEVHQPSSRLLRLLLASYHADLGYQRARAKGFHPKIQLLQAPWGAASGFRECVLGGNRSRAGTDPTDAWKALSATNFSMSSRLTPGLSLIPCIAV